MAKQKTSRSKPASQPPTMKKRKRVGTTDSTPPAKKARPPTAPERKSPKKSTGVKQEMLECDICAESKPVYRNFPSLPACSHDATTCSDCYQKHFITKINQDRKQGWSVCTCPLCGEKVEPKDAQSILPRHISRDLVAMIKNVSDQSDQDWIWCLGPDCGRGQLHTSRNKTARVVCKHCKFATCSKHQIKWHEGLTCEEFDEAGDHDANIAKSVEEIQRTTKPCPHCKTRIKKEGGCNHMTCTGCRKFWLWDTVAFDGEEVPSTAEVRGGSAGHQPLNGEERQAVEQVIRFENGDIGNPQAGNGLQQAGHNLADRDQFANGFLIGFHQTVRQGLNFVLEIAAPRPQPDPQPQATRNAPVAPRRRQRQAQAPGGNRHTRNTRSTRPAQVRIPRRPAGPGFDRWQRPVPNQREVVTIDSDSSDSSDSSDDSDSDVDMGAQRNVQGGRRRPGSRSEVIDLTQDDVVIDLTEDD